MFTYMSNSQAFGTVFFLAIGAIAIGSIVWNEYQKTKNRNTPQARFNKR